MARLFPHNLLPRILVNVTVAVVVVVASAVS